jgi:hypothetical protein
MFRKCHVFDVMKCRPSFEPDSTPLGCYHGYINASLPRDDRSGSGSDYKMTGVRLIAVIDVRFIEETSWFHKNFKQEVVFSLLK